jgi:phage protein D
MSDEARRAYAQIIFQGVDISGSIRPYLKSLTYTDNEEGETDDLQIVLHDREDVWLQKWLSEAIEASASNTEAKVVSTEIPATCRYGYKNDTVKYMQQCLLDLGYDLPKYGADGSFGTETLAAVKAFQRDHPPLEVDGSCGPKTWAEIIMLLNAQANSSASGQSFSIQASIVRQNWKGDGKEDVLGCGNFELDDVQASGPPSQISLKATSLPFSASIRQTKKNKPWEAYYLSGILSELAKDNGMSVMYLPDGDPYYERVEQFEMSDIAFLSKLCKDAGYSLKCTNNSLVVFDQVEYEAKDIVRTITKGDGSYERYTMSSGTAGTQYASCRVSYVDPSTGQTKAAVAKVSDYKENSKTNQQLEITAKVSSIAEALALAEKQLRLHNKYEKTAKVTLPGDPYMVAGVTVELKGFGAWNGKYIIRQSVHKLSQSGYTTEIALRKVLGGY